jgi:hypothetical protein
MLTDLCHVTSSSSEYAATYRRDGQLIAIFADYALSDRGTLSQGKFMASSNVSLALGIGRL